MNFKDRREIALMRVALGERMEQLQQHLDEINLQVKEIRLSVDRIHRGFNRDRSRP